MKRVLIADLFSKGHISSLKGKGVEVMYNDKLNGEPLKEAIATFKPHVLVVRSTKVTAAHMAASETLEAIIRAGSGVDTIDLAAASKAGIYVGNCPGRNAVAVAELVMGLLIASNRRIVDNVMDFRDKKWNKGEYSKAQGIKGKHLGIIGFGFIGREVALRADAFGMPLHVYDPYMIEEIKKCGLTPAASIDEVIAVSDVVTIHVPAVAATKGMVTKAFLSKMKKDALLINTSRADLVVEADILAHLEENKNFRYAADVFAKEPADKAGAFENQLAMHPRVYGTHHIGASTTQAEESIGDEAYHMILEFQQSNVLPNCVNKSNLKTLRAAPGARPRL